MIVETAWGALSFKQLNPTLARIRLFSVDSKTIELYLTSVEDAINVKNFLHLAAVHLDQQISEGGFSK